MKNIYLLALTALILLGSGCKNGAVDFAKAKEVLIRMASAENCHDFESTMSRELYTEEGCNENQFDHESKNKIKSEIQSCVVDNNFEKQHKKFSLVNVDDYSVVFRCGVTDNDIGYIFLKQVGSTYKIVNYASDATKEDAETATISERVKSLTEARREERADIVANGILNPVFDPRNIKIDNNDESKLWDYYDKLDGIGGKVGFVEKVNERGEFVVSTIVGDGEQKILNIFHVLPSFGSFASFPLSLNLNDCQRKKQIEFLRNTVEKKKIVIRSFGVGSFMYVDSLTAAGADKDDKKIVIGEVGIFTDDEGDSWRSSTQPLDALLAKKGYLKVDKSITDELSKSIGSDILKAIEIARVRRDGFWGICK